jgi:predicted dienelactone hydrolase
VRSGSLTFLSLISILVLGAAITGCNSNSAPLPPPPNVTVSVSAATNTQVEAGGTISLTASAVGDPASKGVTWSLLPATGAGSLSNTTSSSATYNAPASPPPSDLMVTIIATSVSNPANSNNLILDVPPIFVSVSATPNPVGAGGTTQIAATVTNDPANMGVDPASWSISQGAGTLSNRTSTSVTYTAPATAPSSDQQVTITATSASAAPQTGSTIITFAAIAVSLSASPISVPFCPASPCSTSTSQITATVNFDPANQGVDPTSWKITAPTSGGGTLSSPTTTTVTYTAPSTPPATNLLVTITAVSKSDSTKSGPITVTVLAITVLVSPTSAILPVTITQPFTPTVLNDPTNAGVTWTTTQGTPPVACSPASTCGTLSATGTLSGIATTYTAPAAVPPTATVALTATSVTDTTKSAIVAVTLTNGTVKVVPASLNFGSVKTSRSRSLTTTLTNTGTSALTVNSPTFTGPNPGEFSVTANTCGTSVAAGASCTLTVTFRPASASTYGAFLNINDSSTDSPQLVALIGRGSRSRGQPFAENALAANRAPAAPVPTGANAVGTQVMDLVDPTRNDPFLANGARRELLVRFWYPASTGQACARADYASPQVWSDFSRLLGISLPHVTTNSCWNTSMADGAHPVVIFTHGYTGTFTDYTFLFEDLASRGYVVASVDHTFEATAVEFPDGRLAESVLGSHLGNSMRADADSMDFAVSVRLNDLQFVLNALASLNSGNAGPFAGKLDMSRVALAGHSLGGLTTILGVEQDSRYRAGVVLDGVMPNAALHGTETPMLLLAAGRDTWSPEETRLWSGLRGPRIAVNFQGAEHLTSSDAVWLAAGAIKTGTMGPDKTIAAIRNYVAAFLDANLLDKPLDPLLTGPSSEFPDAAVTTRRESLRAKH